MGESSAMEGFREQLEALQKKNIEKMVAFQQKQEEDLQDLHQENEAI